MTESVEIVCWVMAITNVVISIEFKYRRWALTQELLTAAILMAAAASIHWERFH